MSSEVTRRREWEALHADLLVALEPLGRNDPFGKGDFWLVDDDWGGCQHKICVTSLPFLTQEVAEVIRHTLEKYSLPWEVVIALDFPDPNRPSDGEGVLVRKSSIEPNWDSVRIAEQFGTQFRWEAR